MCVPLGERSLGSRQDDDGLNAERGKRPSGVALKDIHGLLAQEPICIKVDKTREKTRLSWAPLETLLGELEMKG